MQDQLVLFYSFFTQQPYVYENCDVSVRNVCGTKCTSLRFSQNTFVITNKEVGIADVMDNN